MRCQHWSLLQLVVPCYRCSFVSILASTSPLCCDDHEAAEGESEWRDEEACECCVLGEYGGVCCAQTVALQARRCGSVALTGETESDVAQLV